MVELPPELSDDPELMKKVISLLASERNDFFVGDSKTFALSNRLVLSGL